jgi:glycosyltransferase involved in cell wall biosynthesis
VGQPLVTSDTNALREYFGGSAIFVQPKGDAIAAGVLDALSNRRRWIDRMTELRELRQKERAAEVFALKQAIQSRLSAV